MGRLQGLVGGLVSLVLMTTTPTAGRAAPRMDRVTGTGHARVFPPGAVDFSLRLNVRSGALGEEPKGRFSFRIEPEPGLGESYEIRGRVTCLRAAGNLAAVGGVVERSTTPSIPAGAAALFAVLDARDPGLVDGFVYGIGGSPLSAGDCPDPESLLGGFYLGLVDGGFRVRDATP